MKNFECVTVEVSKLALKPGDVLVLKLPTTMTAEAKGRAVDCAIAALGSKISIFVIPLDVELSVLEPGQTLS